MTKVKRHKEVEPKLPYSLTLWELGLRVLDKEISRSNRHRVAQHLEMSPSTVWRWVEGDRGRSRPNAKYLERIFETFQGTFEEVLMEAYDARTAELVIKAMQKDPETVKEVLELLLQDDERAEKLKNEIKFLTKK